LCRRIKEEDHLREIPVIFLTALTDTNDLVEGFKAGGVDYITKPFRREELLARVKSHVELSQAKRNILAQAELIQQINRTRDRMYSVISHDIKSPFANISMMISMIADGYLEPDSDDFKEIIENLNYSTKETYTLLENLLQWTRTQTGNLETHPEDVSLLDLVENSMGFVSMNAEHKEISIEVDVDEEIGIHADPNMIKSVIRNLLSNAIKFTHRQGVIKVKAEKNIDHIALLVIDNGVGMSEEQVNNLFKDNIFSTTAGTGNEKGSGLGLHLVYDFTRRNGGRITVQSMPDEGTTFRIEFRNPPAQEAIG
jgi:two-component system sensor histidine kinase/response regulator